MALVFRNESGSTGRCAIEISRGVQGHPEIQLRMGIHSGPVNEVTDVNDRANIAGAGINIAQRVMDCGDAGHILRLQTRRRGSGAGSRSGEPFLHELGECEAKAWRPRLSGQSLQQRDRQSRSSAKV